MNRRRVVVFDRLRANTVPISNSFLRHVIKFIQITLRYRLSHITSIYVQ